MQNSTQAKFKYFKGNNLDRSMWYAIRLESSQYGLLWRQAATFDDIRKSQR